MLDILEIGARGDGIAEHEGRRYFVPFTLPGETVKAEPRGERRPGRGEGIAADLMEVLAPSRHREPPPCAHFTVCGGCALQHWRRDVYTAWKVELITRALAQRGVDAPRFEPPLIGAPGERRRADFVLRRQGKSVLAGFHERTSLRIVDVGVCVVVRPTLGALLEPLRTALASILPDGGAADAVVNETDSGIDLLLRPHKRLDLSLERREALVALAERADLARLSWRQPSPSSSAACRFFCLARPASSRRPGPSCRPPSAPSRPCAPRLRNGQAMCHVLPICLLASAHCRSAGQERSRCSRVTSRPLPRPKRRHVGWARG
jgi:23S rRNA (uracil1939-C5)-methyltransferase